MNSWQRWVLIIFGVGAIALAGMLKPVKAYDDPHGLHHEEFYRKWLDNNGHSCCNSRAHTVNGDCAPISDNHVRSTTQGLTVYLEGEWVAVEPDKVRPYIAPDMSNHLCHKGKKILCYVHGGGT